MTTTGNQETRIDPGATAWQSSDFNAGIPIKKRRYPVIRSPSPGAEEPPSWTPQENGTQSKEHGSASWGLPVSDVSGIETSASCSLDAKESVVPPEKGSSDIASTGTVGRIVDHPTVKIEEPSLPVQSVTLTDVEKKEKTVEAESSSIVVSSAGMEMKSAPNEGIAQRAVDCPIVKMETPSLSAQTVPLADVENKENFVEAKTELKLARTSATAHDTDGKTHGKQKVEGEYRSTELRLGCKESFIAVAAGGSHQFQENEESLSLNLSLSKGEHSIQEKNSMISSAGGNDGINRSNWDLNITMDAWEGAPDGTDAGQVNFYCSNANIDSQGIKPSGKFNGTVNSSFVSQEQGKEKVGCRSDTVTMSTQSDHQDKPGCSLSLGLNTFSLLEKSCSSSSSLDQRGAGSSISFSGPVMSSGNANSVNLRAVKPEPLEEILRQEVDAAKVGPMRLSDIKVKRELVEGCSQEGGSSNMCVLKSADPKSIKPKLASRVHLEAPNKNEATSNQLDKQMAQSNKIQDLPTCSTSSNKNKPKGKDCERVFTCLTEMTVNPGMLNYSESMCTNSTRNRGAAHNMASEPAKQFNPETISSSVGHEDNDLNISGVTDISLTEDGNIDERRGFRLQLTDGLPPDSHGTKEGSLSDEEKINLSGDMLEEDLYGSDYESDGGHDLCKVIKKLDGGTHEFEDGEVRGSVTSSALGNPSTKKREVEHQNYADYDNKKTDTGGLAGDDFSKSPFEVKITEAEAHGKTGNEDIKERLDALHSEKTNNRADEDTCLIESVEMPTGEVEMKRLIQEAQRKALELDVPKDCEGELSSDQIIPACQGISGSSIGSGKNVKIPDMLEKNSSTSNMAGLSLNGENPHKDASDGGSQSRIINLTRVSSKSPGKTLATSGSFLPLRTGRERLPDFRLETDKFHPRGRDDTYSDGSYKSSRERHHDQFSRNSRSNFISDGRRLSSRMDTMLRDRDSESRTASKFYGGRREFSVSGRKYDSDLMDEDIEFDNYGSICQDGGFVGSGQRRRRLSNDEVTFFSHSPSKRCSPGWRDGPTARGFPLMRKVSRNCTPGRCGGENDSTLHRLRGREKFVRGLPCNNMGPVFTRPQPSYEDLDGHFVRGQKKFSSMQRRGLPRFRSRSPTRSGARSPGSCSSFRPRSPDMFVGHPNLPRRISPPSYRMQRMRSPDDSCFPDDMVIRRHGSPPYLSRSSNGMRGLDSGRSRGYPRSGLSRRNQAGRGLFRSHGKFDVVNPRQRTDCDDYFEGPSHSGQFGDYDIDGNIERRQFGNRRNHVRSFGRSFSSEDCEPPNAEDDPESFRFCQADDAEIQEQGSLREFERGGKSHAVDVPRRTRNIEEKEGSSRHGGEVWDDDGFDDISRGKRKRFD